MKARPNQVTPRERRTVGYIRVSTDDQATNGVSLEVQEARIAAFCTGMGWELSEVLRDAGVSAKSLERPGVAAMLAGVRSGEIARVVILKLDRLTRSVRDLADLVDAFAKADASLVSISETLDTASAGGRMVVNMLGVVAQWEREATGERTSAALAHKRRNRQAYSTTPFGWGRVGDRLVPLPEEQEALKGAMRMDCAGASYREIARMLEGRGVIPHRGKAWYASTVRAMLRSKMTREATAP